MWLLNSFANYSIRSLSVRCFLFPILNHLITFSKLSGKTKCNRHIHLVIIDFFFTSFANEDIKAIEKLTELQEKSNKNDRSRLCSCFFPLFRCVRSNKLISNQLNTSAFCIYVNIYTMWNTIKKKRSYFESKQLRNKFR